MDASTDQRIKALEQQVASLAAQLHQQAGVNRALTMAVSHFARFWGGAPTVLATRLTGAYEQVIREANSQELAIPLPDSFRETGKAFCEGLYQASQDRLK